MTTDTVRLIDCRPRPANIVGSASDTSITHGVRGVGVDTWGTHCGRKSLSAYSWRNARNGDADQVDCKRCRRALGLDR